MQKTFERFLIGFWHISQLLGDYLVRKPIQLIIKTVYYCPKEQKLEKLFSQVKAKDFEYVSEGACNVILRYIGNIQNLKGYVLRTSKKSKLIGINTSVTLQKRQVAKLIPRKYLQNGYSVNLKLNFLKKIAKQIKLKRPEKRKNETLEFSVKYGLLLPDLTKKFTHDSSVCIEIKPKCGFLPDKCLLSEETREIKSKISRFQLHQILKKATGKWSSISCYEPLDLFSGEFHRIKKAIECLIQSPQNNLRVFLRGKRRNPIKVTNSLVIALSHFLTNEPIFEFILKVQKLDKLDIENVYFIYKWLIETPILLERITIEFFLSSFKGSSDIELMMQYMLIEIDSKLVNFRMCPISRSYRKYERVSSLELLKIFKEGKLEPVWGLFILRDFLLATTFKDCSVMISTTNNNDFKNAQVTLVDLDRKFVRKMKHYFQLDQDIIENYRERNT